MIGFRETFNLLEGGNGSKSMYDDDVGSVDAIDFHSPVMNACDYMPIMNTIHTCT